MLQSLNFADHDSSGDMGRIQRADQQEIGITDHIPGQGLRPNLTCSKMLERSVLLQPQRYYKNIMYWILYGSLTGNLGEPI